MCPSLCWNSNACTKTENKDASDVEMADVFKSENELPAAFLLLWVCLFRFL